MKFPRLLFISTFVLLANLACESRKEAGLTDDAAKKSPPVAIIDLRAGTPDSALDGGFFPLSTEQTFWGLHQKVEELAENSQVSAILLRLGSVSYNFAKSEEIAELLMSLKPNKKIICHAHALDNTTAQLVHQACDEVWVTASGDVATVGIAAELSYVKGVFDKIGVEADMLAMGRYKSGGEALTRTSPTEDSLGNLEQMLQDLRQHWLSWGLIEGETPEERASILEDGPYTPQRAKELGLITHVGFLDEALASAQTLVGDPEAKQEIVYGTGASTKNENQVAQILRLLAGADPNKHKEDYIALVPAIGSITMSGSGPMSGGSGIQADTMTKLIRNLREDEKVRAIVMRMDSPGGSPLASDLIWRELMLAREKKPVVISVGSMAASGGYYIASAANAIVSDPSAIVGSIGVFGGKIVLGGAFEKIGVTNYPVAPSPNPIAKERALHLSTMRKWDEPTRERVRQSMKRIYDLFIDRVVEGRDMKREQVAENAQGAIFLATRGLKLGLVDELGGLKKAIAVARNLAALGPEVPVELEGDAQSLAETLFLGSSPSSAEVEAALLSYQKRALHPLRFIDGQVPLSAEVRTLLEPIAASIQPLLNGEHVSATMPYAITIH